MASFAANISYFVKKTKIKGVLVMKKIAFDGLRGVVLKSPVDTGRFRGNWQVSINTVDLTVDPKKFDKAGPGTLAAGQNKMNAVKWEDTIYISNNVPYAGPLEYGHSKQAPRGMLRLTFLELKASLQRIVAQLKAM